MKKVLSFLIILTLCVSCFSISASADSEPKIISINQNGNKVAISLTRPQQDDAVLIVAVYNGVKLLNIAHKPIISSDNGDVIITINIPKEATTIKAFVWDGLNTMQPLCESKTFSDVVPPSNYGITLEDIYYRLDGSTVTEPLSIAIAAELFGGPYLVGATVKHNQTDNAIKNVIDGKKDLALVTYPSQENLDYAQSKGIDLVIVPVVNDAFVFIVNGNNSIDSLTKEQIRGIYGNQITTWEELGGTIENWDEYVNENDRWHYEQYGQDISASQPPPILPFQRNSNSGSQSGLIDFMGDSPISVPFFDSHIINSMGPLIDSIAEIPSSIGYSYLYFAHSMWQVQFGITKFLAVDGIAPTNENIANGTYPIITPYYAVFRNNDPEDSFSRAFTRFILSPEGQKKAEDSGYVKLSDAQNVPLPKSLPGGSIIPLPENKFFIEELYNKLTAPYDFRFLPQEIVRNEYNSSIASIMDVWDWKSGDDTAVRKVIDENKDIALCMYPSDDVLDYAAENDVELEIVQIINDAFVFIVDKDNPVNNLTMRQLQDIYNGDITNWNEVEGNYGEGLPLRVYEETYDTPGWDITSKATQYLYEFLGIQSINAEKYPRWKMGWGDDPPDFDFMSGQREALGYSFHFEDGSNYKVLTIDGIAPGDDAYPMNIPYYAVIRKSEEENSFARRFLEYLLSQEGQSTAESIGYLKVSK